MEAEPSGSSRGSGGSVTNQGGSRDASAGEESSAGDGGTGEGGSAPLSRGGSPVTGSGGIAYPSGDEFTLDWLNPDCGDGRTVPRPQHRCHVCLVDDCPDELSAMLGSQWRTGVNEGPCSALPSCARRCACGDEACGRQCWADFIQGLNSDPGSQCTLLLIPLALCVEDACGPSCRAVGG